MAGGRACELGATSMGMIARGDCSPIFSSIIVSTSGNLIMLQKFSADLHVKIIALIMIQILIHSCVAYSRC